MAKFPEGFSMQATPIEAALHEGRTEDAKTLLCDILRAGKADAVVQRLAAELIKPPRRRRGKPRAAPKHWFDIGDQFNWLRDNGEKREDVLRRLADKFGYSESHIVNAVKYFDAAKAESDAEAYWQEEQLSGK